MELSPPQLCVSQRCAPFRSCLCPALLCHPPVPEPGLGRAAFISALICTAGESVQAGSVGRSWTHHLHMWLCPQRCEMRTGSVCAHITGLGSICWTQTLGSAPARLSCGLLGGLGFFFSELWDQQPSAKGASQILPQQQNEDKKGSGEV